MPVGPSQVILTQASGEQIVTRSGRDGHVEPSDILDAAPTAGLTQTSTVAVSKDWAAAKLVVPKGQRAQRR